MMKKRTILDMGNVLCHGSEKAKLFWAKLLTFKRQKNE
jgi:hypothetical protein